MAQKGVAPDSLTARRSGFRVAGITVEVVDPRCHDVVPDPRLQAFRVAPGTPDVAIRVEWFASLPILPGCPLFDSGSTWQLYEQSVGLRFDFCVPALGNGPYKRLLIDDDFSTATLQISERSVSRSHGLTPLTYPLDELLIMHRLTQEKAIELHSSGIVREDGVGNLFVGHSGAGKSTTTRLWTEREEVEVLSDDRIIVRRDGDGAETPRSVRSDTRKMRMYGTPWHGEAMFASPNSAPLARIFVLEHGHGNVITPLTPSQAVAELFARSFVPFHRHKYVDAALEFLQELVDAVPVYRYAFEPDQRAVDTIINFHD